MDLSALLASNGYDDRVPFLYVEDEGIYNFVPSFLMKAAIGEHLSVCLVTSHYPLSHYTHVGRKLGYNLASNAKFHHVDAVDTNLKELWVKVCDIPFDLLIIEDASHFIPYQSDSTSTCVTFVRKLQKLAMEKGVKIVFCQCALNADFSAWMKYASDMTISLKPLRTGYCKDVSGHITISKRRGDELERKTYMYLLGDRSISINPNYL